MPLTLPNLDDRKYLDLLEEARTMIPTYAPKWTNHNPSDPGIMLIELFAYLTEMQIYRLNRITGDNIRSFLKLLNGPAWQPSGVEPDALAEDVRQTILTLRARERAVSCEDFEDLTLAAAPQQVARARCVPRRNLESENPLNRRVDRPGHVSVIIVPSGQESKLQPGSELIQNVQTYLEPRRLLTTRVHVVGPRYFTIGVRLTLVLERDAVEETVRAQVVKVLERFLHPLTGGPDGRGWPFGRNVYVSEIYELLDTQPGVDYVTKTIDPETDQPLDELTTDDPARLQHNALGELVAVEIQPDELVETQIDENDITIISPLQA